MEVGVAEVDLNIEGVRSLKEKRKILKSIITRIQNKFNLSIAEIDYQDKWQRSLIGLAGISNDKKYINKVLEKAVTLIESDGNMIIIDYHIYFL
ncbi:DUF503 domain-containing protein [Natranaerobius trueperi]|uniref:DUF503 domain-containing protein n=1 Tax=Natranaerobius trueperi TaxID=759412 RepID=A0A226BX60_9FIRM|nr:DUF503 domain-containing protein [Natranaerobius trueperi]OWZ83586.1 hypothetical protein CDO51_07695 [Natranaerobius trueperi]